MAEIRAASVSLRAIPTLKLRHNFHRVLLTEAINSMAPPITNRHTEVEAKALPPETEMDSLRTEDQVKASSNHTAEVIKVKAVHHRHRWVVTPTRVIITATEVNMEATTNSMVPLPERTRVSKVDGNFDAAASRTISLVIWGKVGGYHWDMHGNS